MEGKLWEVEISLFYIPNLMETQNGGLLHVRSIGWSWSALFLLPPLLPSVSV